MTTTEYISATDTAKLVRQAIKNVTTTKASVTTKKYSGGASIDVVLPHGTDDDTVELVRRAVAPYEGAGFDGSIDLAYNVETVLLEDGRVAGVKSSGTVGSGGAHQAFDTTPDVMPATARKVHFMADYIFVRCDWK